VGDRGIHYTFPATAIPASVEFELVPSSAGLSHLTLQTDTGQLLRVSIFVMP